jgi:isopenicillin-N epimerase
MRSFGRVQMYGCASLRRRVRRIVQGSRCLLPSTAGLLLGTNACESSTVAHLGRQRCSLSKGLEARQRDSQRSQQNPPNGLFQGVRRTARPFVGFRYLAANANARVLLMPETTRTRRRFLRTAAALPAMAAFGAGRHERLLAAMQGAAGRPDDDVARDEGFWLAVQQAFSLDARHVILNGGASDPMPRAVLEAYIRDTQFFNASPLVNGRVIGAERERIRQRLAGHVNCDPDEIAITRGTTEGLNIVIAGLRLERGDEIVTTDFDYYSVLHALRQRAVRDGLTITTIPMHWPVSDQSTIVEAFARALTPRTRAILCSHVSSGPGHIMPVPAIAEIANARGIQLIVDGAIAFGHIVCDVRALGCDYYATSLHKFLGAPPGTGFLYVRRQRIGELWPLFGTPDPQSPDIRKFERIGSHSPVPIAAIGETLDFHEAIGPARKEARLRYLSRFWTDALTGMPGIRFLTSLTPAHSCAIVHAIVADVDAGRLATYLQDRHGLWVYGALRDRPGLAGLWVAPNVFTRPADLRRLADELRRVARNGLSF